MIEFYPTDRFNSTTKYYTRLLILLHNGAATFFMMQAEQKQNNLIFTKLIFLDPKDLQMMEKKINFGFSL